MYCPRCSQPQVSDEVRFCPRCGIQLGAVQALLAASQGAEGATQVEPRPRAAPLCKRDFLLGATAMLAGAVAVALLTVSVVAPTPWQAVVIPLLLLWAAVASVLLLSGHAVREVAKLFAGGAPALRTAAPEGLVTQVSAARQQALPTVQSAPAAGLGSWRVDTAELAHPPSVTERTTDLLGRG